jgi:hypothetical protein
LTFVVSRHNPNPRPRLKIEPGAPSAYSYNFIFSTDFAFSTDLTAVAEAMFDEDAGVFDYEQACGAGFVGGILVFDSLLHPDDFCADGDGAVDNGWDVFGAAKNIDNFDVLRFWDGFEAWVRFFAEDFGFVGIYGDDAVSDGLYILSYAETGATVIG